jgi:hypothetical protein
MSRRVVSPLFLAAALIAGCDSAKPKLAPSLPHGGTAFTLPGGQGYVEALRQDAADPQSQAQIVVYFFDAERNPLSATPTAVSFTPRARGAKPIALRPTGDADPQKAGGLASAPFPESGEIVGTLSATIQNKPVSVSINIR